MGRQIKTAFITFVFIVQATITLAGQLSDSVALYQRKVQALISEEQNPDVRIYLESCLAASHALDGLEAGDPRVSSAFNKLVKGRLDAMSSLKEPGAPGAPGVKAETEAYNANLFPYRKSEYLNLVSLQEELLDRKYFKTETSKTANFLEGYVNSRWSLTRSNHGYVGDVLAQPHLGVSPWEAIFRLEPALAFDHGARVAILGTAGLSYSYFPEIDRKSTPMVFQEDFWSKCVRKSGARLGVGVGDLDNKAKLLVGAGAQINALGVWGLYKPDGGSFLLGISATDLSKFKKLLPWFD